MKKSQKVFGATLLVIGTLLAAGCSAQSNSTATTGAGVLDASFGTANDGTANGVVDTSVGAGNDKATDVAVQADGKIIAVGDHVDGSSTNVVLARYNVDGSLDDSFGSANDGTPNGLVNTSLGNGDDHARGVALQSDGKIVVTGDHVEGSSTNIFVARYNVDGSLDDSFGTANDGTANGVVNISLGNGDDTATSVALQSDGKIVVAGTHVGVDGSSDIAVLRYNTDGSLDESFGTSNDGTANGIVDQSLGSGNDVACGIALQSDGKIVVVGNHSADSSNDIAVIRFNTDGSLDDSFGTAADNTPNGVVNTSLGAGDDFACGLAIAADGKILVGGYHLDGDSTNVAVLRFATDGSLDPTFGVAVDGTQNGVVNTSIGDGNDVASAIALQTDGKLLVAGYHANGDSTDITVLRYLTK